MAVDVVSGSSKWDLSISSDNCEYRGEGNSSLVVRLKKEGKVLRLLKDDDSLQSGSDIGCVLKQLQFQGEFVRNVIIPLVGSSFVNCPVLVFLSADQIKEINRTVHSFRPVHRCMKSIKEVPKYAFLLDDFCFFPPHLAKYANSRSVFSIEIKLKQGYMLNENCVPDDCFPKATVCRFCLMQYFKLRKGTVDCKSGYCPLDLFSGSPLRMQHAIKQLFKTPQNNLRIFKDQEIVFSEENKTDLNTLFESFVDEDNSEKRLDIVCDLIIQALLAPFPSKEYQRIILHQEPQFCKYSFNCIHPKENKTSSHLPEDCVLDRILQVQRLDSLDISQTHSMYLELRKQLDDSLVKNSNLYFEENYPKPELPAELGKVEQQNCESEIEYFSRKIWEFLIALTAKDFSVMITFQQVHEMNVSVIPPQHLLYCLNRKPYIFSISVMDLDPKAMNKVEKIYKDDQQMIEAYLKDADS